MTPLPLYLIVSAGPLRDRCVAALGSTVEVLDPPLEATELAARPPGVVLLEPGGMSALELTAFVDALPGPEWRLGVLQDGEPPTVRAASLDRVEDLDRIAAFVAEPEQSPGVMLVLDGVLTEISTARHDLNNPLTSALAETQILLMDVGEGEVRTSLLAIQEQLRRMRDLLAGTRHLRLNR